MRTEAVYVHDCGDFSHTASARPLARQQQQQQQQSRLAVEGRASVHTRMRILPCRLGIFGGREFPRRGKVAIIPDPHLTSAPKRYMN